LGVGFRSFVKRREQSLFCNICGVKDEILCSNKNEKWEFKAAFMGTKLERCDVDNSIRTLKK